MAEMKWLHDRLSTAALKKRNRNMAGLEALHGRLSTAALKE
ncbi:hypothetical protein [Prevotella aurantiaca]